MSSSKGRVLVDEYPTELSLPAKQLCPEARIEDSTPKTKNFLPPASHLSSVAYCLFQPEADPPIFVAEPSASSLLPIFHFCLILRRNSFGRVPRSGLPAGRQVTSLIPHHSPDWLTPRPGFYSNGWKRRSPG